MSSSLKWLQEGEQTHLANTHLNPRDWCSPPPPPPPPSPPLPPPPPSLSFHYQDHTGEKAAPEAAASVLMDTQKLEKNTRGTREGGGESRLLLAIWITNTHSLTLSVLSCHRGNQRFLCLSTCRSLVRTLRGRLPFISLPPRLCPLATSRQKKRRTFWHIKVYKKLTAIINTSTHYRCRSNPFLLLVLVTRLFFCKPMNVCGPHVGRWREEVALGV